MPKVTWPRTRTDQAVRDWLASKGIDHGQVMGYTIRNKAGDIPTIELTMHFDEPPAERPEGSS
jgi:hypothetical protein